MKRVNQGQSSIEFIIVFGVSLSFFTLFLSLGINITLGYLVHHAVFEASRVYLVADGATGDSSQDQRYAEDRVLNNLKAYKNTGWPKVFQHSIFQMKAEDGFEFQFNRPGNVPTPEYIGVYFRYKRRLVDYGLILQNQVVDYISESFLGKEPVRSDCYEQICETMRGACEDGEVTVFDNGC